MISSFLSLRGIACGLASSKRPLHAKPQAEQTPGFLDLLLTLEFIFLPTVFRGGFLGQFEKHLFEGTVESGLPT